METTKSNGMRSWAEFKNRINKKCAEFNSTPEGLKEIEMNEFMKGLFHYCFGKMDFRQVCDGNTFTVKLFPLAYKNQKHLGFAIIQDWFDSDVKKSRPEPIYRFARYGNDDEWNKFIGHFAGQFQGDNS